LKQAKQRRNFTSEIPMLQKRTKMLSNRIESYFLECDNIASRHFENINVIS